MTRTLRGALWIGAYLVLILAPLFVLLVDPGPTVHGFWVEFSVALGFAALGMMGMQFILTARFRRIAAPFGTDILYYVHRYLGLLALGVVTVHVGVLLARDPGIVGRLAGGGDTTLLWLGVGGTAAMAALLASSLWREPLGIPYEAWRLAHGALAGAAVGGGLLHALGYGTHTAGTWKRVLWILYGAGGLAFFAYLRLLKPLRTARRPWRVTEVRPERADCATLVLEPEGHEGLDYLGGQFAWLTLEDSPFAMREHPFSFSSSPADAPRVAFTIQAIGDWTREAVDTGPGARAYVEGPHGVFTVEHNPAPGYVFIAGGIGAAPFMSALKGLADRDDGRPLLFLHGVRTWERAVFREELERLEVRLDLDVAHVLEEPHQGWDGERGLVDRPLLERRLPDDRDRRRYFVCGPEPMIRSVERSLQEVGIAEERIHSELFHWV